MKTLLRTLLIALCLTTCVAADAARDTTPKVTFAIVDVVVDAGAKTLAAYQVQIVDHARRATIVGVEGGAHAAFTQPPYYDPAALSKGRIVLAAFSTRKLLPKGRTRVARLHLRIAGGAPEYVATLQAAASADGKKIPAKITLVEGGTK